MRAAIRRADELNRLRDLPDTPAHSEPGPLAFKIAKLPAERVDAGPETDDDTRSIIQPPPATIPIDIGEASSFELPVAVPDEPPPVMTPARLKSGKESRIKKVTHRHVRLKPKPPAQFDLFKALFGDPRFASQPPFAANAALR